LIPTKAKPAKAKTPGEDEKRPGSWRGGSRRGDHQNEAISSNRVVHMASVAAAMHSDCGVVGSSSSSDIPETTLKAEI
jgi:hypothetical protein